MKFPDLRFIGLLATSGLGGCGGMPPPPPPSTIQASDEGVFQPGARVSVNLSRLRGEPSDPQTGHAIELGLTQGSGSSSQSLGSNRVVWGSQTFTAPQQLRYEFDFTYVDVSYRYRHFFGESRAFGLEALGGLGYADLDFTVRSATQRASENLSSPGLALGVGGIWRLRPTTSLQGRLTATGGGGSGISNAKRIELYLVQALGRNAALRAGYSSWEVESDRGDGVSKLELKFSGPALGVDVMF
jgi:hypothetical protein